MYITEKNKSNITYRTGDIFSSQMEFLVNPTNCVGVMGGGLALAFKEKFPRMYERYRIACGDRILLPGAVSIYPTHSEESESVVSIICFPTKDHYKDPSELVFIEEGLRHMLFLDGYIGFGGGIAFPKLGCGLGGLDWNDVKPIMVKYLSRFTCDVEIYE